MEKSNKEKGKEFEDNVKKILEKKFKNNDMFKNLEQQKEVNIGLKERVKTHTHTHKFDLGNDNVLIECKAYEWNSNSKNPIGPKIDNWKNAMFYFIMAGEKYKKFFVVEKKIRGGNSKRPDETLLQNFIRLKKYCIPKGIYLIEIDEKSRNNTMTIYDSSKDKGEYFEIVCDEDVEKIVG